VDCINLAQDRDKKISVGNAIMNLLSFIEWGDISRLPEKLLIS
jgi:hypothetical protein